MINVKKELTKKSTEMCYDRMNSDTETAVLLKDAIVIFNKYKKETRKAIAMYMRSEGCSCCENTDDHREYKAILAKLLNVPKYKDGSGYDFYKFYKFTKK